MAALSITAGSVVLVSGPTDSGVAGATLTAGMALYEDAADSNSLKGVDADAEASAVFKGIALHGASDGQPIKYASPGATVNMGATLTVGVTYYAGLTAGDVGLLGDLSAADYVTIIGVGLTAANMYIVGYSSGVVVQ